MWIHSQWDPCLKCTLTSTYRDSPTFKEHLNTAVMPLFRHIQFIYSEPVSVWYLCSDVNRLAHPDFSQLLKSVYKCSVMEAVIRFITSLFTAKIAEPTVNHCVTTTCSLHSFSKGDTSPVVAHLNQFPSTFTADLF